MEAIGAAVGTAVISAIIEKLTPFAVGEAVKVAKKFRQGDLVEELRSLELNLNLIKDLLDDAESKQNKQPGMRSWLEELKDAAYDAEDVLDEYATDVAILQQRKGHVRKWIKGKVNAFGLKKKIKCINGRFDQLARNNLGLQKLKTSDEGRSRSAQGRETSSLPDIDSPIIGRDEVKQEIIKLLTSNGTENNTKKLPVLPIVGMGGFGKTTIARFVFHDDDVKKHFSLRIWIFVSQDFDAKRLLKSIIEYVYADRGERKTCQSTSLDSLHNETKELIEKRKFLLILDDAWNEEQQHWNDLLKPLKFGDNGSRVLVTTRSENVAKSIVGHMDPINLGAMDSQYIWEILVSCAFNGVPHSIDEQLKDIGKQIVEKIKGSPLAAKTIGRLLGTDLNKKHWKTILESDFWEVKGQKEYEIIPSLWLSYQYLPPKLKNCFSLCSLFPKGHHIYKEELSYLWIAHSIFEVGHGMRLENSALEAIRDLRGRSLLFQDEDYGFLYMHDLIHDVSEFVAQEDHLHIADEIKLEKHPIKLRHLSFSSVQWESKFPYGKLRSVLRINKQPYSPYLYKLDQRVLDSWLNESTCLRVLNLYGCDIEVLPNSIGKLKHLRYLNLSDTGISELPKSLTSLYNLQALWLEDCYRLNRLPDGMGNLVNLRLLLADYRVNHTIKGIRGLSSLQVLRYFDVDPKYGSGIEELEYLDMLGGDLSIRCLENVVDPVDARKARLERKEYLQGLTLEWSRENNTANNQIAERILENLQPNGDGLKSLKIGNYKGRVLPSWLTQDGHRPTSLCKLKFISCESLRSLPSAMRELSSLQSLELINCHQMQSLPDMTLPASLQHLEIHNCKSLTSLPSDMTRLTSLQRLTLYKCPKIESWADIGLPASLQELHIFYCESLTSLPSDMTRLTSLQRLGLSKCQKIESLADIGLPVSLQEWEIRYCESLASLPSDMTRLISLQLLELEECPRLQSFPKSGLPPSLSTLRIVDCSGLQSFPESGLPPSLSTLEIWNCPGLQSFPESGLPPSLSTLEIWNCPGLQSFPESGLPPSLSTLEIWNCPGLQSFPESGLPPSLSTLEIWNCPGLQSFPESGLPPSLSTLIILHCPALQEKYRIGPERTLLISHIPEVYWG